MFHILCSVSFSFFKIYEGLLPYFPGQYPADNETVLESSSKLQFMRNMLESFAGKDEKVVIVSNSTKVNPFLALASQIEIGLLAINHFGLTHYSLVLLFYTPWKH